MKFKKTGVLAALLSGFLLLGSAVPMHAFDKDDRKCERQIHNAEEALEKAVRRHGEHSRQAEQKRHQLEETRERCKHHDHDHDHDHH
jgi:hypothetical protein